MARMGTRVVNTFSKATAVLMLERCTVCLEKAIEQDRCNCMKWH